MGVKLHNQDKLEKEGQRRKRRPAVKPTVHQERAAVAEREGRSRQGKVLLSHLNAQDQDLNWRNLVQQSKVTMSVLYSSGGFTPNSLCCLTWICSRFFKPWCYLANHPAFLPGLSVAIVIKDISQTKVCTMPSDLWNKTQPLRFPLQASKEPTF